MLRPLLGIYLILSHYRWNRPCHGDFSSLMWLSTTWCDLSISPLWHGDGVTFPAWCDLSTVLVASCVMCVVRCCVVLRGVSLCGVVWCCVLFPKSPKASPMLVFSFSFLPGEGSETEVPDERTSEDGMWSVEIAWGELRRKERDRSAGRAWIGCEAWK